MADAVTNLEAEAPRPQTADYRADEPARARHAASIEREAHGVSPSPLDVDAERTRIDGVVHVRVFRDAVAAYKARVGTVMISRSLFRAEGSAQRGGR